jgi:hypothetical protein
MRRVTSAIALALLSANAFSAVVVAESASITSLTSYSEQGVYDGDIFIVLASNPAGCPGGYWLRHADTPGYRSVVAFLVSAFHANTPVRISGYNDPSNVWSGNGTVTCRTDQVSLAR